MKFGTFTLLSALLLAGTMLNAQDMTQYKTLSLGLNLGLTKSYTDITQYTVFPTFKNKADIQYGAGLSLKKSLSNVFGVQLNANYARLQGVLRPGGDPDALSSRVGKLTRLGLPSGGAYFQSNIFGVGVDAVLNLSNIDLHYRPGGHRKLLFYVLGGVQATFFNPQVYNLNDDSEIANTFTNASPTRIDNDADFALALRSGAGLKYRLNEKMDIGWELAATKVVGNDALDGAALSGSSRDIYASSMFSLNFKLGKGEDLIDWINPGKEIHEDIEALKKGLDSLASAVDNKFATADTDGDGVVDTTDKEPFTPFGSKVDADGKGIDSDGDGVYDGLDKEPNTPAGKLVNFQGLEIKTGESVKPGLPPVNPGVSQGGNSDAYFPSVFFDTNTSRVRAYDIDKLVRVAILMQKNSALKIRLVGHADVRGGTEFNNSLGQKRAQAVKDYLVKNLGVDANRVTIESKGEASPLSPSENTVNRRVDIMGE